MFSLCPYTVYCVIDLYVVYLKKDVELSTCFCWKWMFVGCFLFLAFAQTCSPPSLACWAWMPVSLSLRASSMTFFLLRLSVCVSKKIWAYTFHIGARSAFLIILTDSFIYFAVILTCFKIDSYTFQKVCF